MANIYLYAVAITHMQRKKQDIIDCLESLVLSHLYYFLHILNKATVIINCNICYNLNLFDLNSTNS